MNPGDTFYGNRLLGWKDKLQLNSFFQKVSSEEFGENGFGLYVYMNPYSPEEASSKMYLKERTSGYEWQLKGRITYRQAIENSVNIVVI